MVERPDQRRDPADGIETERVGGHRSARAAVVVALVVLVAVAWIGVTGRVTERPPSSIPAGSTVGVANVPSHPSGLDASTTALPAPTVSLRAQPSRRPLPTRTPFFEPFFVDLAADDALAVIAFIDGRHYLKVLEEVAPGRLETAFRLPFPARDDGHRVQLAQLWTQETGRRNFVELGRWPLSFSGLSADRQPDMPIFKESVAARPRLRHAPRPRTQGFSVTLRAESWGDYGVVRVELVLGSPAT